MILLSPNVVSFAPRLLSHLGRNAMIRVYPIIDVRNSLPFTQIGRSWDLLERQLNIRKYLVSDKYYVANGTKNIKLFLSEIPNVIAAKIIATVENWM